MRSFLRIRFNLRVNSRVLCIAAFAVGRVVAKAAAVAILLSQKIGMTSASDEQRSRVGYRV